MKARAYKKLACWFAAAGLLSASYVAQAAPVVDVLVLYIDAAQNTSSGRDMDARIGSYIAYSNQAFANSDVDMRLRLVGAEKVDLDYTYVTEQNLNALRSNADVARLRQKYGADLVTLINLRQPMSGGYVCGIGYVPPGDANTGRLYSNASSAAFSLVGVDCGLSTFAHELGHNMSMGHSYLQSSEGGVWQWARGHGVQGLFSTIMAYPQSYGTRNQLQQFSNPKQIKCSGLACGVEQNHREGADASANLNNLGAQIEAFMPQITTTDTPDTSEPELPLCEKDALPDNLIANGEFNDLQGWSSLFGASRLTQVELISNCIDNLLAVTERTAAHGDAYVDLGQQVRVGKDYALTAKFGINSGSRETVSLALRIVENGAVRYQYLKSLSVTASELTAYSDSFRLDATAQPSSVGLVIYGPQAGIGILADEVALRDVSVQSPVAEPTTVLHERFEQSASGWSSYGGSRTAFSTHAAEGRYGLRSYSRDYSYSGPIRDVTGLVLPGESYSVSASVYAHDSSVAASSARIWLYYVDDQGEHWMEVVNAGISSNAWQQISGNFNFSAVGNVTQVRLLVGGPRAFTDLYADDLRLIKD